MTDSMPQRPEFPGGEPLYSARTGSRGMVVVTGNDRIGFLTRIMSGELPEAPGAARTALLGPRGNLIAPAVATVTSGAVLLECERTREEALAAALDRYRIADDVEIALAERGDFEIVRTDAGPDPGRPDPGSPGWVLETGSRVRPAGLPAVAGEDDRPGRTPGRRPQVGRGPDRGPRRVRRSVARRGGVPPDPRGRAALGRRTRRTVPAPPVRVVRARPARQGLLHRPGVRGAAGAPGPDPPPPAPAGVRRGIPAAG